MDATLQEAIDRDGFAILGGVLSMAAVQSIAIELESALSGADEAAGPIRSTHEAVVASRNLLRVWPAAIELARGSAVRNAVAEIVGLDCGLVRALYFDKPPDRSWSLPWHKDVTIAVRDNRRASAHFSKPTIKAGVPHVEAPECVLRQMLTVRVHLDDVNEENGPLLVVAGSHHDGKAIGQGAEDRHVVPLLVCAGDAVLMRPLVTHCSHHSAAGTQRRRRTIHLEFAAAAALPDGYEWYEFHALNSAKACR